MDETFTPEEEALLTPFNAAAYDMLRRDSKGIQPCWLCMSDEARAEAREELRFHLQFTRLGRLGMSMEDAEALVALAVPLHLLDLWRAAELERKAGRAKNDPHAFFMQNAPPQG